MSISIFNTDDSDSFLPIILKTPTNKDQHKNQTGKPMKKKRNEKREFINLIEDILKIYKSVIEFNKIEKDKINENTKFFKGELEFLLNEYNNKKNKISSEVQEYYWNELDIIIKIYINNIAQENDWAQAIRDIFNNKYDTVDVKKYSEFITHKHD